MNEDFNIKVTRFVSSGTASYKALTKMFDAEE